MPVPTETGFIEFKGWCPFKFENKISAAKWHLTPLKQFNGRGLFKI
jgi:hypothetical protein